MEHCQHGLFEKLPATVTVSGVVMEINENSVSCIGGVSVLTRFIEGDGKFEPTKESSMTCTDISGKFSISEFVADSRELPIAFQIDKYEPKRILIYVSPETNEQNVNVVIHLNRQETMD